MTGHSTTTSAAITKMTGRLVTARMIILLHYGCLLIPCYAASLASPLDDSSASSTTVSWNCPSHELNNTSLHVTVNTTVPFYGSIIAVDPAHTECGAIVGNGSLSTKLEVGNGSCSFPSERNNSSSHFTIVVRQYAGVISEYDAIFNLTCPSPRGYAHLPTRLSPLTTSRELASGRLKLELVPVGEPGDVSESQHEVLFGRPYTLRANMDDVDAVEFGTEITTQEADVFWIGTCRAVSPFGDMIEMTDSVGCSSVPNGPMSAFIYSNRSNARVATAEIHSMFRFASSKVLQITCHYSVHREEYKPPHECNVGKEGLGEQPSTKNLQGHKAKASTTRSKRGSINLTEGVWEDQDQKELPTSEGPAGGKNSDGELTTQRLLNSASAESKQLFDTDYSLETTFSRPPTPPNLPGTRPLHSNESEPATEPPPTTAAARGTTAEDSHSKSKPEVVEESLDAESSRVKPTTHTATIFVHVVDKRSHPPQPTSSPEESIADPVPYYPPWMPEWMHEQYKLCTALCLLFTMSCCCNLMFCCLCCRRKKRGEGKGSHKGGDSRSGEKDYRGAMSNSTTSYSFSALTASTLSGPQRPSTAMNNGYNHSASPRAFLAGQKRANDANGVFSKQHPQSQQGDYFATDMAHSTSAALNSMTPQAVADPASRRTSTQSYASVKQRASTLQSHYHRLGPLAAATYHGPTRRDSFASTSTFGAERSGLNHGNKAITQLDPTSLETDVNNRINIRPTRPAPPPPDFIGEDISDSHPDQFSLSSPSIKTAASSGSGTTAPMPGYMDAMSLRSAVPRRTDASMLPRMNTFTEAEENLDEGQASPFSSFSSFTSTSIPTQPEMCHSGVMPVTMQLNNRESYSRC